MAQYGMDLAAGLGIPVRVNDDKNPDKSSCHNHWDYRDHAFLDSLHNALKNAKTHIFLLYLSHNCLFLSFKFLFILR